MTAHSIAQLIDHALLQPSLTDHELRGGFELADRLGVKAVCVQPYAVGLAKECLRRSPVTICSVVGFPHGGSPTVVKLREIQEVLNAGAREIDMVVCIGKVCGGQYDYVKSELREVSRLCHRTGAILKVIFENLFLNDEQIIALCGIAAETGVDYIKTATGFAFERSGDGECRHGGATEQQVRLMRAHAPKNIRIKVSGGIRSLAEVLKFRDLGCDRIGTSATESILAAAALEATPP